MEQSTVVVHKSDLSFTDLAGVDHGRAIQAGVLDADSPASLRASFVEMEQVIIPRQARMDEILYIISGSIRIEENEVSTVVNPGDTVYLTATSAPIYHVEDKALILAVYPS